LGREAEKGEVGALCCALTRTFQSRQDSEPLVRRSCWFCAEHQLHVAKVINEKGPVFWTEFANKLREFVDQMKTDLGKAMGEDLRVTTNAQSVTIDKGEFPFVHFTASLNLAAQLINGNHLTINPRPQPGRGMANTGLTIHLKLNQDNHLYAEVAGREFHHGHELAEHVMKLLFTI
jgi:hypothetical protein